MKKIWVYIGIICCITLLIITIVSVLSFGSQYTTTEIADYGKYKGNYDNKRVAEFINSFFPKEISTDFSEVIYSYRAQKGDTCAFEAYLEFVVEDEIIYNEIVESYSRELDAKAFQYDTSFSEYVYYDVFKPTKDSNAVEDDVHISRAEIGKVLFRDADNRVIYIALGVYDGGAVSTEFLSTYFNRFNINPAKYERNYFYDPSIKASCLVG